MKQAFDWADMRLFLAIAKHGGLRLAAEELSISPATLSRRMKIFEQTLNKNLFVRGSRGYILTADGRHLNEIAADFNMAVASVERWLDNSDAIRRVSISAGDWTMGVLLKHLMEFQSPDDMWLPDFIGNNSRLDIARREIDIGIRNKRPIEPWLAGQQFGFIDYAVYQAKDVYTDLPFIGLSNEQAMLPTQKWVNTNYGELIAAQVSSPQMGLSLVTRGVGKMVLPRFVGDQNESLIIVGETIEELRSEQWLVVHQDERNHPPVRSAIKAVSNVLQNYTYLQTE